MGDATGLMEVGISVTGGVVYRGSQFPSLFGKYLFGDFSTAFAPANGTLLGLEEIAPGDFVLEKLNVVGGNPIGEYVIAFGVDESGEVYLATRTALAASGLSPQGLPTGSIYRIVAIPEPAVLVLLLFGSAAFLSRSFQRVRWG